VTIYTQQQAATVCGVSVRTLQRRIPALESAGAWKDATGQWHITLDALREAGFTPGRPSAPDPASRPGHVSRTRQSDTAAADARVAELEREMTEWRRYVEMDIAEWRRRAELAEALAAGVEILIIDEPTVGIDIKTKTAIHELIGEVTREGVSVLLISSDMPEMITLADRILVMRDFALQGEIENSRRYEETSRRIMALIRQGEAAQGEATPPAR